MYGIDMTWAKDATDETPPTIRLMFNATNEEITTILHHRRVFPDATSAAAYCKLVESRWYDEPYLYKQFEAKI